MLLAAPPTPNGSKVVVWPLPAGTRRPSRPNSERPSPNKRPPTAKDEEVIIIAAYALL